MQPDGFDQFPYRIPHRRVVINDEYALLLHLRYAAARRSVK